jgi:hypothetical protein
MKLDEHNVYYFQKRDTFVQDINKLQVTNSLRRDVIEKDANQVYTIM